MWDCCRGKKYARLKRNKSVDDWTDVYRPFLVPSVNFPYVLRVYFDSAVGQR